MNSNIKERWNSTKLFNYLPQMKTSNSQTLLSYALGNRHTGVENLLLVRKDAKENVKNDKGQTLLPMVGEGECQGSEAMVDAA